MKGDSRARVESASLSAFSVYGKVLLPVNKTARQIEKAKVASRNRDNLLEAAKNGDEDAMESLTIEDIDLYSQASRRVVKEDIYSIVDTCFMPSGIECDQYSILGEIKDVALKKNRITGEEICVLTLDVNELIFDICVPMESITGQPEIGRRFKGDIWLQGYINFP